VSCLVKKTNGTNNNNNNNSSEPMDDDEFDGFKFTEDVVDKKTMFADETNVAIVSFANDTEINIEDL
jgi:translation elongation factor P/translation initiation factor 5A